MNTLMTTPLYLKELKARTRLLVVTPWSGKKDREPFLEICKASVKESGFDHLVLRCGADWETVIYDLRNEAEYVAWVDDDDFVYPGAIQRCYDALEAHPNLGLAYTDENYVDPSGNVKGSNNGKKELLDLTAHPRSVHHLAVTRRFSVDNEPRKIFDRIGQPCPLDWLVRVRAGAQHGMIHVAGPGYAWRIHATQMSKSIRYHGVFNENLKKLKAVCKSWIEPTSQSLSYL
jgi:hypothetical protein